MRTSKTILLALAIPALLVLVGVGPSASAAPPAPISFPNCSIILCPAGTTCVDKPTPRCVPIPVKP